MGETSQMFEGNILEILCSNAGRDTQLFRKETRECLTTAGLFLLGYELLHASIVDGVRDFFVFGWNEEDGFVVDPEYARRVLAKVPESKKNREEIASALWLQETGALDGDDVVELAELWKHRNQLAHELPRRMLSWKAEIEPTNPALLARLPVLLDKVDRFWVNAEMDTDEDEYPLETYQLAVTPRSLLFAAIYAEITGEVPEVPEVWHTVLSPQVVSVPDSRPSQKIEGEEEQ